jgi:hypothetical protein
MEKKKKKKKKITFRGGVVRGIQKNACGKQSGTDWSRFFSVFPHCGIMLFIDECPISPLISSQY